MLYMTLNEIKNKLERKKGQQEKLLKDVEEIKQNIHKNRKEQLNIDKAREIIKKVGLLTQQQLQFYISDIATVALEGIFAEPYSLRLNFEERRNKTECDILFERDGETFNPLDDTGGGAVDVAAFALRIASWSMDRPRTRPVIILDEPLRFLSEDYHEAASEMIKELSKSLGLQFIIITHDRGYNDYADKVFKIVKKKGISLIQEK